MRRIDRELKAAEEESGQGFSFKKLMVGAKHLGKSISTSKEDKQAEAIKEQ